MQEMLYFISYLKLKGLGKECVLLIDGCFLGGIFGLLIGYVLLEVVVGGVIVLVEFGDFICIDIFNCIIDVVFSMEELFYCCYIMNDKGKVGWKFEYLW